MELGKKKAQDYYDQESEKYKVMYEEGYEKYPANLIRLKLIINRLKKNNLQNILDVGCGTCIPMIKLLQQGFSVKGFDFSADMIKMGKIELKKEGYDSASIFQADLEDDSSLPEETFDAILALGVFPHISDELKALVNMKKRLNDNGKVFIEFRNELFSLFSSNKYSYDFFLNKMVQKDSLPKDVSNQVIQFYSKLFNVETSQIENKEKISYNEILARFRNPLTINDELFKPANLDIQKIHFYHYHALPPVFEQKFPKLFYQLSQQLEKPDDWRGHFMASAFVVEAGLN